jgi:hypothetical protein
MAVLAFGNFFDQVLSPGYRRVLPEKSSRKSQTNQRALSHHWLFYIGGR